MSFSISPAVTVTEQDLTQIVPNIPTTTGAIAGIFHWGPVNERILIPDEPTLAATFGNPATFNAETFFTAANFLAYSNQLWVVRVIDGATSAVANTGAAANVAILNADDYANTTIPANVEFIAKFPGGHGNSLLVSQCDSPNAYKMVCNTSTIGVATLGNTSLSSFTLNSFSGSNTANVVLVGSVAGSANDMAQKLQNFFTNGDILEIGNSTLGPQLVHITGVTPSGVEAANSNTYVTSATITFQEIVSLPANVVQTSVTRDWAYFKQVNGPPTTSNYLKTLGLTAVDEVHVVVVDKLGQFTGTPNQILEVFPAMSRATDAVSELGGSNYYETVLNSTSNYVWFGQDRTGAVSNTANSIVTSTNIGAFTKQFVNGFGGNGETNCAISALTAGYDMFGSSSDVSVSLVMQGKARGSSAESTTPSSNSTNYTTLANYLISNIGEQRHDCVVFISPAKADAVVQTTAGNALNNILAFNDNIFTDSSYAVMDSGYKYQYDKYNNVYRWIPLNGDVAGTCARTDNTNDPWWSPAGFNRGQILNGIKLAYNPKKADRDVLYQNYINPVVTFPGQGTVLFGDKTMIGRASAFDRINVRRLFITLEVAIAIAAQSFLFEFNDVFTRAQFVNLVTPYLQQVQGRRGITSFDVVCSEVNNPPAVIDANQFQGSILVIPARSINFIQLTFTAVNDGVSFSEIVGQNGSSVS